MEGLLKSLQLHNNGVTIFKNPDLEPMPLQRRIWGFWSFFGYWGIPNITIWTWSTGSALLGLGLNLSNVMGAITLGNILISTYICLNSNPGLSYQIGYTVSQRAIFGIYGSLIGVLIRFVLSIIFYGVQSWLGGLCIMVMISCLSEDFMGLDRYISGDLKLNDFVGFVIFQILQMGFYLIKPEKMNVFVNLSCIMTFLAFLAVLIACMIKNNGPNMGYHDDITTDNVGWMWIYAIEIWYGALCPDILNQCDYSRFASSSLLTYGGSVASILITGTFTPLASLLVASATNQLYGKTVWLPTELSLIWLHNDYSSACRCANFFLALAYALLQATFNVSANGFAGGMQLAGMFPMYINITRGAIITALLSWVVQPWNFFGTSQVFMNVMSSFGVVITPIIAISICDYYLIKKQTLNLSHLYSNNKSGNYYFYHGVNFRAVIAWLVTVAPGIPGLIDQVNKIPIPIGLDNFFYGSAIFLFVMLFGVYYSLCLLFPIKSNSSNEIEPSISGVSVEINPIDEFSPINEGSKPNYSNENLNVY